MTMTSTYDHRVIQGAESGSFLRRIDQLLQGEDGFYDSVVESLGVSLEAPAETAAPATAAEPVPGPGTSAVPSEALLQAVQAATSVVKAHRTHGHLAATLDPLGSPPRGDPALDPESVSLTDEQMHAIPASVLRVAVPGETFADALPYLRETYCGTIAYEVEHIAGHNRRVWLRQQIESGEHRKPLDPEHRKRLLRRLSEVEALETYLHKAFLGKKQFSIEGLDALLPMLDEAIEIGTEAGARDVVLGMAHRGRLNVQAHTVGLPYARVLAEFEGEQRLEADTQQPEGGTGDVKYHYGAEGTFRTQGGRGVTVTLSHNPSHLEFIDPVIEGRARADQTSRKGREPNHDPSVVLPVLMHGDAAFPGQGVVSETLNLQALPGLHDRRHGAHHHQQPARLHHQPQRSPLDPLRLGPRQGLRRPDHPRERRRRGGLRGGDAPGHGLPPRVRPRRRDRPDRLPPLRPQRDRRARLHPAGDVRGDQGPPAGAQDLRREAGGRGRGDRGRGAQDARRRHHEALRRPRRAQGVDGRRRAAPDRRARARPHDEPRAADHRARRHAALAQRAAAAGAQRLHRAPQARAPAREAAQDARRGGRHRLGAGRGAVLRLAAGARRADPPDRPGHRARHLLPAPPGAARLQDRRPLRADPEPARRPRPASSCTTPRCPNRPAWASSTATRCRPPTRWCCGRPSSATSSTAPRWSSTSSWSRAWPSGARPRG